MKNKKGIALISYILVLALLSVAALTSITFLGGRISSLFNNIAVNVQRNTGTYGSYT